MNLLPFLLTYNTIYKLGLNWDFPFVFIFFENISILIYNIEMLYWKVLKNPFNMKKLYGGLLVENIGKIWIYSAFYTCKYGMFDHH